MATRTLRLALLTIGTALLLTACVAAPRTDPPPTPPTLNLTPTAIRTFHFTWDAVENATEYRLLEDPTGNAELETIATLDSGETSYTHEVSLLARLDARYRLEACVDLDCVASAIVPVSDSLTDAIGYVKASNAALLDQFGWSVALSADGTTLAVGAYSEDGSATGVNGSQDNDDAPNAGAVYVFVRSGPGAWEQQAYVKSSNTGAGDWFGFSVALSADGSTLAVGAIGEASNATGVGGDQGNDDAPNAGAVYVFVRSGISTWTQQAYVKASNTDPEAQFGYRVALSADGDTLAVGAIGERSLATGIDGDQGNDDAWDAGAAYVFTRSPGGTWGQQAYVKASNTREDAVFGASVALSASGDTLAVGARQESSAATGIGGDQNDESAPGAGAVYVFTRSAFGAWTQQAYVKASNTDPNDFFGTSVALSADGNTLAVGAHGEASNATGVGGNQSNDAAPGAGAVYVFTRSTFGSWTQRAYVKASNTRASHMFGFSVSLSSDGDTLAVGANGEASNATGVGGDQGNVGAPFAGAVYVFARDGDAWSQWAYVKASNTDPGDGFGRSLALSGDGAILAVGASCEDSSARGVGGDQSDDSAECAGAVYLY